MSHATPSMKRAVATAAATDVELVVFDVPLKTGTMEVSAGLFEALTIMNWLCAMGWVSRKDRDGMFEALKA
jgi:hypothetical protein